MKYCPECGQALRDTLVEGKSRLRCGQCGFVYWEDPKVAVAVLVTCQGRVLLGRRGTGARQGLWSFPAGFVDRGERLEDAGAREVREETGLEVELGALLELCSRAGDPVVLAVYTATVTGGTASPGEELTELGWFSPHDMPDLAFDHDAELLATWWVTEVETR